MVYYSRESKYFPYGLMITEFIDGLNGWDAIKKKRHSLVESWKESGKILGKIHTIKGRKFGHVKNGAGEEKSFLKYELKKAKKKLDALVKLKILSETTANTLLIQASQILKPFDKRFRPVLIHGDASRDNSIVTNSGKFILIDWDNATFSIALADYTRMTSWMSVMPRWKNATTRSKAKQAFLQGHGNMGFTKKEIETIKPAMHILFFISLLKFHIERKEKYHANRVLKMLKKLV
jgi:Ser/Thr protein kinase RdoA (MazF antagonist)